MSASNRGPLGVVIVAAGSSMRFGQHPKVFALLAGRTLLEHSLCLFAGEPVVEQVVVVLGEHTLEPGARLVARARARDVSVCRGGATRGASVRAGLAALDPEIQLVAVHDAARPLATRALFRRVLSTARRTGAAVPGVTVNDTILVVGPDGAVTNAPARATLRAVQTPQIARRDWLEAALERVMDATDEGSLLHRTGHTVHVVEGDPENLKITYPGDLRIAEQILAARVETS